MELEGHPPVSCLATARECSQGRRREIDLVPQQDRSYFLSSLHQDFHLETPECSPQNRTLVEATGSLVWWQKVSHLELVGSGWRMSWAPVHYPSVSKVPGDLEKV